VILSDEAAGVLSDLNPWWATPGRVRPAPPPYRRPVVRALSARLRQPHHSLVEVIRGPRQVGKTTGVHQIIQDLFASGVRGADVLFVRFDLELLRDEPGSLRRIVSWFVRTVRGRALDDGAPAHILLDEVHKLRGWSEEVKHLVDSSPVRVLLTGSSSVLVARGGRESLAGRVFTTELPPFSFREVLECWKPALAKSIPPAMRFEAAFGDGPEAWLRDFERLEPEKRAALRRMLERYYARGGYPRLHSGELHDDRWADYVVQTVFENVLGADIPDLFPIEQPRLLRALYLEVAKRTGQEISQNALVQVMNGMGFKTNQPTVGKYLHYLADALLTREFARYPLAKKAAAKVPMKVTLTDLGVRNAILRAAPSLWKSDPTILGPLVETMVQAPIRDVGLQVHFFRDYEKPGDRRSLVREVDFVAERVDGTTLPVEVKFRRRIDSDDFAGLDTFRQRFGAKRGLMVTRETVGRDADRHVLLMPLEAFLAAFA
jgi:predicted AAA+ superfamily ATPase